MSQEPPTEAQARRRLGRSTMIFSVATGVSRVVGLAREMAQNALFGVQGGPINAFVAAFQLPNLIRALVADAALTGAFVPVFSELLEQGDRKRAWRVASTLFWLVLLGLGGLTALLMLIAPTLISIFGYDGSQFDLAVGLSRVLFPIVVLLGLSGIVVAILNTHDHFTVPALTPVAWNLAILGGLAIGVPLADTTSGELYVYAASILVATLIQFLMPLPWLRGLDGRLRPVIDWRDPAVRRCFALMLPVTLTLGLINVNAVIGTAFAARLIDENLAPAAINSAFRLYMLPQGMFAVAITTILFPALSRFAARGDRFEFARTLDSGLRQIAFLLVPAAAVSVVLSEPIVRLIYERGAFDPEETPIVAASLAAFSAGLVFNGWMLLLNRAYYSLQRSWVPTLVALGNVAMNVVLYWALYRVGIWGIPLAVSIANLVGATLLFAGMRDRFGEFGGQAAGLAVARIVAASGLLAAAAYAAWWGLDELLGRSPGAQIVVMALALTAGGLTYVGACRLLGVKELDTVLGLLRRKRQGPAS